MLSNLDYRAALLQAFRACRLAGLNKWQAFYKAEALIKPLPDDRLTSQLRIAFNGHRNFMYQCPDANAREVWRLSWRWAREYLSP